MGSWLSWLERAVHIREVIGSNPILPTLPRSRIVYALEGMPFGLFFVFIWD